MEPVLCALDFSVDSSDVVQVAFDNARQKGSHLIVLHAYRLMPQSSDIAKYRKTIEQTARTNFDKILEALHIIESVPYEFRAEIGFLTDRIEAVTRQHPVSMIVMGQQLAKSFNDHKGISLQQFMDTTNVPVLIVPEHKKHA
jgi:nucleotide-binding universal stress UspA family protein